MKSNKIEIISDSNFAALGKSNSPWKLVTDKGVVMTSAIENSVLELNISNASGINWHGELTYSPFSVAKGDIFTVSFSARAKHPFAFSVWLGQQDSPHKSLVSEETHFGERIMSSSWQIFSHTWKSIMSEKKARLNLALGQIDNRVEIKDISLQRINHEYSHQPAS